MKLYLFSGCGRMHVEGKRCNQSDLRKKGEQLKAKNFKQIKHGRLRNIERKKVATK